MDKNTVRTTYDFTLTETEVLGVRVSIMQRIDYLRDNCTKYADYPVLVKLHKESITFYVNLLDQFNPPA